VLLTPARSRTPSDAVAPALATTGRIPVAGAEDLPLLESLESGACGPEGDQRHPQSRVREHSPKDRGRPWTAPEPRPGWQGRRSLDHWAYWNRARLDFSRPGKPTDNAFAEAFNSVLRRECLSQHYFVDLGDAQSILDRWRADYNNVRPHGSLARSTPADFAAGALHTPGPRALEKSHYI
jgi:hypothetical protein